MSERPLWKDTTYVAASVLQHQTPSASFLNKAVPQKRQVNSLRASWWKSCHAGYGSDCRRTNAFGSRRWCETFPVANLVGLFASFRALSLDRGLSWTKRTAAFPSDWGRAIAMTVVGCFLHLPYHARSLWFFWMKCSGHPADFGECLRMALVYDILQNGFLEYIVNLWPSFGPSCWFWRLFQNCSGLRCTPERLSGVHRKPESHFWSIS